MDIKKTYVIFATDMRGRESSFFVHFMKQSVVLNQAVEEYLKDTDLFLVEIKISAENDIEIVIESDTRDVSLDDCVEFSHFVEGRLDRDVEDYSLTIGSAGISSPFKVARQYRKFLGEEIEVTRKNGARQKAVLVSVDEGGVGVEYDVMTKKEGDKKKTKEHVSEFLAFNEIKTAKPIIKF